MSEEYLDDDFDDSISKKNDNQKYEELKRKIIELCKSVGIDSSIKEYGYGEDFVVIEMPNGREKRRLIFNSTEEIQVALDEGFEKYTYLGDYEAICNYHDNSIEAVIRPINSMSTRGLWKRLFGTDEDGEQIESIVIDNDSGQTAIEISSLSPVMKLMSRGPFGLSSRALSIKLIGFEIDQHNKTLELLRRVTDSLFFQLDIQNGPVLSLDKDRRPTRRISGRSAKSSISLLFPEFEFDESPISLYWYGRSALGMPLLQFLAFYQVIEYYYPTYSQEEARKRVRTILKNPAFRSDRDADIGRLLSIVSGSGRGFGSEKTQLRATLSACLDPVDLRRFFDSDPGRIEFFSAKQKGLTDHKIPLGSNDADLRGPVADLIYDIRCKIVHTKGESSEGEVELLLPFSKEAELMFHDIELIQYVAQQVLVSASVPMTL